MDHVNTVTLSLSSGPHGSSFLCIGSRSFFLLNPFSDAFYLLLYFHFFTKDEDNSTDVTRTVGDKENLLGAFKIKVLK